MKKKPAVKKGNSTSKGNAAVSWSLRIFMILVILFFGMFSLDVFDGKSTTSEMFTGFFIHNIPAFILLILLVIAWSRENIGGLLFIVAGAAMTYFYGGPAKLTQAQWVLFGLPVLVGFLFLLNYYFLSSKK